MKNGDRVIVYPDKHRVDRTKQEGVITRKIPSYFSILPIYSYEVTLDSGDKIFVGRRELKKIK